LILNIVLHNETKIFKGGTAMKRLIYLLGAMIIMISCTTSKDAMTVYDDVYYSPKNQVVTTQKTIPDYQVTYSPERTSEEYQQSSSPQSQPVETNATSSYKSSEYLDNYYPESTDQEYYYDDDQSNYYSDYDYEARLKRFYRANIGFGYYDPYYTGFYSPYYGPGFSFSYGWGWPSTYFSFGYSWGPRYPYYYYNPWCWDPWYSWGYYPYYRPYWYSPYWYGSYGYGYWNGYWDGYIGGSTGYYPEHQNHYYGPRNPRGSSIIGNPEPRASRISSDDEIKNTYISGRASRTEGSSTITGDPNGTSNNRIIRPQDAQVSGTEIISNKGNEERTNIFSTSEPKPTTPEVSRNAENIKPQEPKEGTTTRSVVPISGRQQGNAVNNEKYSKPQQANKAAMAIQSLTPERM
jgi:hypothetical protein